MLKSWETIPGLDFRVLSANPLYYKCDKRAGDEKMFGMCFVKGVEARDEKRK